MNDTTFTNYRPTDKDRELLTSLLKDFDTLPYAAQIFANTLMTKIYGGEIPSTLSTWKHK